MHDRPSGGYSRPLIESDVRPMPSPMALINVQGHFSFFYDNKSRLFSRSRIEIPGDQTKDDIDGDLKWHLKVISGTVNGFIVCI